MNSKKLVTTAKNLNTITKVGGEIFGAVGIACMVFVVLVLILGEGMFDTASFTLGLEYITLHLAEDFPTDMEMMKWYICVGLLGVGVICFMVRQASVHLRAILTPMEESRPFEHGTPGSLRKIAWLTLIGGAVMQVLGIAERMILMRAYPMETLFSSEAVMDLEYSFTVDFDFVWVFCLILFLSYIFSYGQSLQQESDETL